MIDASGTVTSRLLVAAMDARVDVATSGAALRTEDLTVRYGGRLALFDVTVAFVERAVTAVTGPSGSGKSTLLRGCNRLVELVDGATVEGTVWLGEQEVYGPGVDPASVRQAIGMVFEHPNPFARSIFDNVAYGLRAQGMRRDLEPLVEQALIDAGLWDEVRDDLRRPAMELSLGQQQRSCIARALAVQPVVLLLDKPCSALDPVATRIIEERLRLLAERHTVVFVTHDLQQAARASDFMACFTTVAVDNGERFGVLTEVGPTEQVFADPRDPRTGDFLFGGR